MRFLIDKHLDQGALAAELAPAPVMSPVNRVPRIEHVGPERLDEDRYHVLQLAFERDATLLTADAGILKKARNFGPWWSNGHVFGGVIVLPLGKQSQIVAVRSFKDGSLTVRGVEPGDFEYIWHQNLGVDLRHKPPVGVELCDCATEEAKERHRKRYKRK